MSSTYLSEALKNNLKASFQAECKVKDGFLFVRVRRQSYVAVAEYLKKQGFSRLLTVSAIDWMDEDEFEVYFIVHSIKENLYVKASTRIPRSRPGIESLSSLWDNSSMHEREAWEPAPAQPVYTFPDFGYRSEIYKVLEEKVLNDNLAERLHKTVGG